MYHQNSSAKLNINALYKRFRFRINSIYRNPPMCNQVRNFSLSIQGVIHSEANPLTGKLLIIYDEDVASEEGIKELIFNFVKKSNRENFSTQQVKNYKEEFSQPLAVNLPEIRRLQGYKKT
ncbi:MAG: hypothetical protein N2486_06200 [Caloramator sp.]|nr:hypothetical protein [Caloramator sp.]